MSCLPLFHSVPGTRIIIYIQVHLSCPSEKQYCFNICLPVVLTCGYLLRKWLLYAVIPFFLAVNGFVWLCSRELGCEDTVMNAVLGLKGLIHTVIPTWKQKLKVTASCPLVQKGIWWKLTETESQSPAGGIWRHKLSLVLGSSYEENYVEFDSIDLLFTSLICVKWTAAVKMVIQTPVQRRRSIRFCT